MFFNAVGVASGVRLFATEGTEVSEPLPSPLLFFALYKKYKARTISVSSVSSVANYRSPPYREVVTTGNTMREGVICE